MVPGVVPSSAMRTTVTIRTDQLYLASFPGAIGYGALFLKKSMPAAFKGEYKLADILNSPVQWDQLDNPIIRCACGCRAP